VKNNFKKRMELLHNEMENIGVSKQVMGEIMDLLNSIYTFSITDTENINKEEKYNEFLRLNFELDKLRNEDFKSIYGDFLNNE
jgi:hypothetical protein